MSFTSKSGKFNIMDTKAIDDNSGHVSKFFKLSPDSISKFNKEENLVKKMNQDICEITEKITEKMVYIYYFEFGFNFICKFENGWKFSINKKS
jgi:hypothetical protein